MRLDQRSFSPERLTSSVLFVVAVIFGVVLVLFSGGCCSTPTPTHIRAEAKAWERVDKHLDRWLDEDEESGVMKPEEREAWRHLNTARRLRVKRALEALETK